MTLTDEKPLPTPNADTRIFWEQCRQHRLKFQQCVNCGHIRWPPSFICPSCYSASHDWIASAGRGTVFTFVVYHQAFHPAFENDLPYVVAIIELAEGPRILSNIVHCRPDAVTCGMPVELTWEDVTETVSLPKFQPAADAVVDCGPAPETD